MTSTTLATSLARAIVKALPLSIDSSSANSSACDSTRSARRSSSFWRATGFSADHVALSSALRAARTARSTSSAVPRGIAPTLRPLDGSNTGKVSPDDAGVSAPSTIMFCGLASRARCFSTRGFAAA
jgi:hypothetical protein